MGGFSSRLATTLLLLALTGCHGDLGERFQSGRVLALAGLQGRWAGDVVPLHPSCGAPTHGLMSIGSETFGFDPFEGTEVIQGVVTADGHLNGVLKRQGGDHQDLSLQFQATASQPTSGDPTISGKLVSARCQWAVTLHRA